MKVSEKAELLWKKTVDEIRKGVTSEEAKSEDGKLLADYFKQVSDKLQEMEDKTI